MGRLRGGDGEGRMMKARKRVYQQLGTIGGRYG